MRVSYLKCGMWIYTSRLVWGEWVLGIIAVRFKRFRKYPSSHLTWCKSDLTLELIVYLNCIALTGALAAMMPLLVCEVATNLFRIFNQPTPPCHNLWHKRCSMFLQHDQGNSHNARKSPNKVGVSQRVKPYLITTHWFSASPTLLGVMHAGRRRRRPDDRFPILPLSAMRRSSHHLREA